MNITYFNSYKNSISTIWNIPLVCRWCSCFFASLKRIFQLAMFDCQRYYPIFHWYSTNIPVVFHAYVLQQNTISPFNIYMSYSSNFFLTAHSCDSIPRFFFPRGPSSETTRTTGQRRLETTNGVLIPGAYERVMEAWWIPGWIPGSWWHGHGMWALPM